MKLEDAYELNLLMLSFVVNDLLLFSPYLLPFGVHMYS